MSQEKKYAQQFEDLLNQNVNVSSQQVQNGQNGEQANQKLLALQNLNSLALYPRHSIERGIPLSKNMLSEDVYMKEYESSQEEPMKQEKQQKPVILQNQEQWLVDQLDLPKAPRKQKFPQNTKNVLRNFGNAQNQYALYNKEAIKIVQKEISNPETFFKWVRQLKLENFQGFKNVWGNNQKHSKAFVRVYKKLCWLFYIQTAIPYVLSSRMRDPKTKTSHLKYVFRFLQGLKNPQDFTYFKKVEK